MKSSFFKTKKGITLIELIVVIAIFAIILAEVYPMLNLGNTVFASGSKQNSIQSDLRRLSDSISDSVKYASNIDIIQGTYDPDTFIEASNPDFGYDYIYLQFSGSNGIAVKKLSYSTSTNSYSESTILSAASSSVSYDLSFKSGGTGSKLLAFDMYATDGSRQYALNSETKIMNAALGTLNLSGTGSAIKYKTGGLAAAANVPPTAAPVTITGIINAGQTLTGNYTYYDADGDSEALTSFKWYKKAPAASEWTEISGAVSASYTISSTDVGMLLCFEVTPRAASGVLAGLPEKSQPTTEVTNLQIPAASDVDVTGIPQKNEKLNAVYTYSNAGIEEGASIYCWFRSTSTTGGELVAQGTKVYNLKQDDVGYYIYFTVKPVAENGSEGPAAKSNVVGPIAK